MRVQTSGGCLLQGLLLCCGLALVVTSPAMAQTTNQIAFQGQALTGGGQPIPNGAYRMSFTLFNVPTDGSSLWSETNFTVPVAGGLFTTLLGSIEPFPEGLFGSGDSFYLEIAVDADNNGLDAGDLQSPRTPLNATPVALHAKDSAMLGGAPAADYAKAADLGGLFRWQEVTGGPVDAVRNQGYVIDSESEVLVTLPPSDDLAVGDVVRVNGIGQGGWTLAQSDGQRVLTQSLNLPGASFPWIPRESNRNWIAVASSADGTKLVAVVLNGRIYTSIDSGETWTPRETNRSWSCVTSSADGTKLVAAVQGGDPGGQIYTSIDSGETWTPRETNRNWKSLASSADGTKLVAAHIGGQLYTSTDSGETWTPRETNRDWRCVASSADGTKLVAAVNPGQIYTSTDSGETWTPRATSRPWASVASSADGTKLVACEAGSGVGKIYTSTNSGVGWTTRDVGGGWVSVASSSDCTRLVAVYDNYTPPYVSMDSGATWSAQDFNRDWNCVASSADGKKLVAGVQGGQIYTFDSTGQGAPQTTIGTSGGLSGGQNTAVELQYIGNGTFVPLNHDGTLAAF